MERELIKELAKSYVEEVKQKYKLDDAIRPFGIDIVNYESKLSSDTERILNNYSEGSVDALLSFINDGYLRYEEDDTEYSINDLDEVLSYLFDRNDEIISRERFAALFQEMVSLDKVDDLFEKKDSSFVQTERFIINDDPDFQEVSFISKDFDHEAQIVNWYKFSHIGRALNLHGIKDEFELIEFFAKLREDIDEELSK